MNWFSLFFSRLKALFRNPASLFVFALCILAALSAGFIYRQKEAGRTKMAIVNTDTGELGDRIEGMLIDDSNVQVLFTDEDDAYQMLMQGKIQCYAVIPPDFTDRLETIDYHNLVELRISTESSYSGVVTEPLVKAILKLWYEKYTVYKGNEFLKEYGLSYSNMQEEEIKEKLLQIWDASPLMHVVCDTPSDEPAFEPEKEENVFFSWYSALLPFYLVICCIWMLQDSYHSLLKRICRGEFEFMGLLLSQSIAGLIPATLGFVIISIISGNINEMISLLPYFIVYEIGCLGPALILCSVFRNLSTLLLISPAITLLTATLSGLMIRLPDWAGFLVILSRIFPGRNFYYALIGNGNILISILISAVWLLLGIIPTMLIKMRA